MSGIENLNKRLRYHGGKAEDRFIKDKLKTLKKALIYSYQAETAVLADGREFRCLLNKDKLSMEHDDKIISIPYKDICLNQEKVGTTSQGEQEIGLKCGDIFQWKETHTYWIVLLQYLEENAYFRADVRKCNAEIEVNGKSYRVYFRGPTETTIQWNQKKGIVWNDINYSAVVYVPKNDDTLDYFHRFKKIKIDGNNWEVATTNPFYGDGIIKVCLNEYYNNTMEDAVQEEEPTPAPEPSAPHIAGDYSVKPYDIKRYEVQNAYDGIWSVSNPRIAKIVEYTDQTATIEIITGRSNCFDLIYTSKTGKSVITQPIKIKSL